MPAPPHFPDAGMTPAPACTHATTWQWQQRWPWHQCQHMTLWFDGDDPSAARMLWPDHHHQLDDDNSPSLSMHTQCDATTTTTGMMTVPVPACMHAVTQPTMTTTGDTPSASTHAHCDVDNNLGSWYRDGWQQQWSGQLAGWMVCI